MTISELITEQILESYAEIHEKGVKQSPQEQEVFDAIVAGEDDLIKKFVLLKNFRRVEPKKIREILQGKERAEVIHYYKNGKIENRVVDRR